MINLIEKLLKNLLNSCKLFSFKASPRFKKKYFWKIVTFPTVNNTFRKYKKFNDVETDYVVLNVYYVHIFIL